MSSLSNTEDHLEEQSVMKGRVDNSEEKLENAKPKNNLPRTMETDKNKELATSTIMGDLSLTSERHCKLPSELNCQIFYCLNVPTRRKFICGLGWGLYAISRQSLLIKSKRLCNPKANVWRISNRNGTISEDGLNASNNTTRWHNVYAEKGFPISAADCRADGFPGKLCYYYEVTTTSEICKIGLSHGGTIFGVCVGFGVYNRSSYAISTLAANGQIGEYQFRVPMGARPEPPNAQGNVYGCGILMDPENTVTPFFTFNGILLWKQIPITPSVDHLFPAVSIFENVSTLAANFGDDKNKPFAYDITNCPGMGLNCI